VWHAKIENRRIERFASDSLAATVFTGNIGEDGGSIGIMYVGDTSLVRKLGASLRYNTCDLDLVGSPDYTIEWCSPSGRNTVIYVKNGGYWYADCHVLRGPCPELWKMLKEMEHPGMAMSQPVTSQP
jgi:hypothetical protein